MIVQVLLLTSGLNVREGDEELLYLFTFRKRVSRDDMQHRHEMHSNSISSVHDSVLQGRVYHIVSLLFLCKTLCDNALLYYLTTD